MPMMPGSNPVGMMGGAPPALGTEAPQGAGFMASPSAGLPSMPPGNPQTTMMLGQMAAKLLQKQQGVKYTQDLLKHIRTIMQKVLGANMLENPAAESDISNIIAKLASAADKVGKAGPTQSPALSTSLASMVNAGGGSLSPGQ